MTNGPPSGAPASRRHASGAASLRSEPSARLDNVWLDDRQRCRWALRGVDLTLTPGQLVAILGGNDDGGPDAVIELLAGRRIPSRGRVSIDGIDLRDLDRLAHRRAVVELELLPGGERRLCLPNATMIAVRPTPATLRAADGVVTIEDGLLAPTQIWRQ